MVTRGCCFKKKFFISILITLIFAISFSAVLAQAELIDNGDGTITDTGFGIMWLKDANMSATTMTWDEANEWAENLEFAGYDDWRLPSSLNQDGSGPCYGENCTGSEMGHLYYDELLNPAGGPPTNTQPFENVQTEHVPPGYSRYWLGPDLFTSGAMMFQFEYGGQGSNNKSQQSYVWAVRNVVPMPTPPEGFRLK